jgi:hypothetical protein
MQHADHVLQRLHSVGDLARYPLPIVYLHVCMLTLLTLYMQCSHVNAAVYSRLHAAKLTDAQKGLLDLMLLERIKAKSRDAVAAVPTSAANATAAKFDTLK